MKIFISWSGAESRKVALALRKWIPTVLPFVEVYVSSEDTEKGKRWIPEITKQLEETNYGIVCVVPGNAESAWLNFEAGALSKAVAQCRVSPFLLGITFSSLPDTLGQFQCTIYERDDMKKLVKSLNAAAGPEELANGKSDSKFKVCWPWLKRTLDGILKEIRGGKAKKPQASVERAGTAPTGRPSVDAAQIKILKVLGEQDGQSLSTSEIANFLAMKVTRLIYHLGKLEKSGYIYMEHGYDRLADYNALTDEGLAFVVENGLV